MGEWSEDIITVEGAGTLDGLFRERVRRTPDAVAYRHFDRTAGQWRDTTWRALAARVERWRAALAGEGLPGGARVAVSLRNGVDWVSFDQAALAAGLVVVPLYTDDRPDNVAYCLRDSAASVLLLQDAAHWRRLRPALDALADLGRILLLDDRGDADAALAADPRIRLLADWLAAAPDAKPGRAPRDPDQLASIVYTSGTTGRPKGVMLSHRNMLSVAHAALTRVDCYRQDLFLSFLPLSHTLERTCGYYVPMMAGATVAFARSV
ncbi:MAG TPA: AMP-binding protein, partial [Gammaproteobacteria bacterium]|nr:AMP-binding protein [Gammaproteobacteria bacterium]